MAQIQTTDRIKAMQQSKEQSQLRELSQKSAKVFYEDSVLPEEQRPDDEPDIDTNDTYDEDEQQDTADVRIDDFSVGGAQPIWLLHDGQILWAGDRTGHKVNEINQFRRRLQSYLDVLRDVFDDASDTERLEALHGFFKETNKKSGDDPNDESDDEQDDSSDDKKKGSKGKGGWLRYLSEYSIICGENRIMSLREFRTDIGKSKGRSADDPSIYPPDGIMKLWVQHELNRPENRGKAPGDIFTIKKKDDGTPRIDEIYDSIQTLCDRINEITERYIDNSGGRTVDSPDGSAGQSDGDNGIGLASPFLCVWIKEPKDPSKSLSSSLSNQFRFWKRWAKKDGNATQ